MSSEGLLVPVGPRGAPNTTTQLYGPHIRGTHCPPMDYRYDPIKATICAMYIVFGIVYTLFGNYVIVLNFISIIFITKNYTYFNGVNLMLCWKDNKSECVQATAASRRACSWRGSRSAPPSCISSACRSTSCRPTGTSVSAFQLRYDW